MNPDWLEGARRLRAAQPRHVLFLCVANSARSQMAEGIARAMAPASVRISSAGSRPSGVNPLAVRALREIGIDIGGHRSKSVDDVAPEDVDAVVTLCADEVCPVFLGRALRVHWALPDPAAASGDELTRLQRFREVRDELRRRLIVAFSPAEEHAVIAYDVATPDDLVSIQALLERLGLPSADVGRPNQTFLVARAAGELVGCIGIEQYGKDALFRSFAVVPQRQGAGVGTALHDRAVTEAARRGTRAIFLLTTTAEDFCLRHGYSRTERGAVPPEVAGSAEFQTCCPSSAACMTRVLR